MEWRTAAFLSTVQDSESFHRLQVSAAVGQALEEGAGSDSGSLTFEQFEALLLHGEAQLELYDMRAATSEAAEAAGQTGLGSGLGSAGTGPGCMGCCLS